MSNNIKGITIEIGGNTGPLNSVLKDVNKAAGDAQSELKEVNKQLKFDPKNVVLSGQKIDLLKDKAAALEEKQKTLKAAVDQAHAAFEKGELGADKVRAVEREYEKVNSQLKETKKDLAAAEVESGTFTEKVKGKFSQLKDKIKDTFSAENIKAGLGAVGVAVGAFLKSSLDTASNAEKTNANLAQTLKSTKGAAGMTMQSLNDLTQAMVNNTTFSGGEVKAGEAMLLTFTNIGKDVFPQATSAMLDFAQKMGTDPTSAAMTLGKALNDPVNGLSKLTRSGVTFTDQQKKQITAMQKAGDTAGAQKLMIAELNKEFGGQAAAAADTYAGKQKQLQNQLNSVKSAIGMALIPILQALIKPITPILQAIAQFVTAHPKLTAAILAVIAVIGTLVGGLSLANTVAGLFGHTMQINEILMTGGIMLAIMALIAVVALVISHWSQISTFFVNLWNTVKDATVSAINAIITWFSQLPGKIWTFLVDIVTKIGQWGTNMVQKAAVEVPLFINRVVTFYAELPGKIWTFLVDIISKVVQWCGNLISTAGTEIPKFVSTVVSFISELPGKMLDIGSNIVHGIWDGINGAVSWLHDRISDFCGGIVKGFKEKLKIHSPSVLFADVIGKNLALGIGQGFTENMKAVVASMTAVIPTTWDTGTEVRTAMAAAYGGYSVPVSTRQTAIESVPNSAAQTGGINVNQYFQGKVPTPAENARLTRNGLQQVILKLRK